MAKIVEIVEGNQLDPCRGEKFFAPTRIVVYPAGRDVVMVVCSYGAVVGGALIAPITAFLRI